MNVKLSFRLSLIVSHQAYYEKICLYGLWELFEGGIFVALDVQKLCWKVFTQVLIDGKIHINVIIAHKAQSLCTFHDFQLNARYLNSVM